MHGVSVMGLWSVAMTVRWLCSQEHPQASGQPHPREPTLDLSADFPPPEYSRVGHARLPVSSVLLREAFCPGTLPHHQRLLPQRGQLAHLQHLFSECCAGGRRAMAARGGEGPWSADPWDTEGWSHPVLTETAFCHEDKAAGLCGLALKVLSPAISWRTALGPRGHPLCCSCCSLDLCLLQSLLLEAHLDPQARLEAFTPSSFAWPGSQPF